MSTISNLETQAISAAKKGDWEQAISLNASILQERPDDVGALNRTGFAYLQSGQTDRAIETYKRTLEVEKDNAIAARQLENIRQDRIKKPEFAAESFVEEPSKSKIISLLRLANKDVLETLNVGQKLNLRPKGRFISIETEQKAYIGSLPEDISLRLAYLIEHGNQYLCQVHSANSKHASVFIRETYQSPENRNRHSFISNFQPGSDDSIGEDLLLLADESPLNMETEDADGDSSST